MKINPKILILFCFFLMTYATNVEASGSKNSGFTIEPALSLSTGVVKQSGISDIGTQSTNFEARLGYRISMYSLGFSYALGSGTAEQSSFKGDYKPVDIGMFFAAEVPYSIKVTAGYIFSAKTKIQPNINSADFSGSGFRFGIAYTKFQYVNLMLESISRTYSKYDGNSVTNALKDSTLAFSVGFRILN